MLVVSDEKSDTTDITNDSIVKTDEQINKTIYRIQIGAFNNLLSEEVFAGVENVIIENDDKDGLVKYMTGSFTEYKDAIDYQAQMKARGFDDAFIVMFKNGNRINLNIVIKPKKKKLVVKEEESTELVVEEKEPNEVTANLKFTVQIMVASSSVSAADLTKMSELGNCDKVQSGSLYKYYAGTYSNLEDANIQLEKAKLVGFSQAFVFATNNGERITLEKAKELLK